MPKFSEFIASLLTGSPVQGTDKAVVVRAGVPLQVPSSEFAEAAAAVAAHVAAANPHSVYLKAADLPVVSAARNGILPDGSDVTAAVNALIASGNIRLVFGPGTYLTSGPIQALSDNTYIEGAGIGATIIRPKSGWATVNGAGGASIGGVVSFVGVNRFGCKGITADARTNNIVANGIVAMPTGALGAGTVCTYGVIRDNEVKLKTGSGYHIWNLRAQHMQILGNQIDGGETSYNATPSSQEGIELYGGHDVLVEGNYVKNVGNNGLYIQSISSTTPSCELENIRVINNEVEGCARGLLLHPTYDAANGDMYAKDILIQGNQFKGNWLGGIHLMLNTASVTMEGITVDNNTIRGPASGGQAASRALWFDNQVASLTTVNMRGIGFTNNKAFDIPLSDSGAPFYLFYFNGTFKGNILRQNPALLTAGNNFAMLVTGCTADIDDNILDGARTAGMSLNSGNSFCSLKRNKIRNWNINLGGNSGIIIQAGDGHDIFDTEFDTAYPNSIGNLINVGTAGMDKMRLGPTRYRNSNNNVGTWGVYLLNADKNWAAGATVTRGMIRKPVTGGSGLIAECVVGGTTHASTEPTWPNAAGAVITDGTVTWVMRTLH